MQTKLTLRLEKTLIDNAKQYAKQHGKSVSQLVVDYFVVLTSQSPSDKQCNLPLTQSLKGILKKSTLTEKDYKAYLEDKYS